MSDLKYGRKVSYFLYLFILINNYGWIYTLTPTEYIWSIISCQVVSNILQMFAAFLLGRNIDEKLDNLQLSINSLNEVAEKRHEVAEKRHEVAEKRHEVAESRHAIAEKRHEVAILERAQMRSDINKILLILEHHFPMEQPQEESHDEQPQEESHDEQPQEESHGEQPQEESHGEQPQNPIMVWNDYDHNMFHLYEGLHRRNINYAA